MYVVQDFELIILCKDMLNSMDDGPIGYWARGWYHPHAHSHKQGYTYQTRSQRACCGV